MGDFLWARFPVAGEGGRGRRVLGSLVQRLGQIRGWGVHTLYACSLYSRVHAILENATYGCTSLARKRTPLGPYRRPMHRVVGGWAFSHGRGNPVAGEGEEGRRVFGSSAEAGSDRVVENTYACSLYSRVHAILEKATFICANI